MANDKQLSILKQGAGAWNRWIERHHQSIIDGSLKLDLRDADLRGAVLDRAMLYGADLTGADLGDADLGLGSFGSANLTNTNLRDATLYGVDFSYSIIDGTDLRGANLHQAYFDDVDLSRARLRGADLSQTNLSFKSFRSHDLQDTSFEGANLTGTDFSHSNLAGSNLSRTLLIDTDFSSADLSDCRIFGVAAWNLKLDGAKQTNLTITKANEPPITIDNVEVAQFVYLVLNNPKLRDVIDTIGKKAVLILGRFTPERKSVLDKVRDELRTRNYVPIVFDFDAPVTRNTTETVVTLAHLSRFIIADITSPRSIPQELQAIVPTLKVAVQPIISADETPYAMFPDIAENHQVLPLFSYNSLEHLVHELHNLINSAEDRCAELRPGT